MCLHVDFLWLLPNTSPFFQVPETKDRLIRFIDTLPADCCGKPKYFISHRW